MLQSQTTIEALQKKNSKNKHRSMEKKKQQQNKNTHSAHLYLHYCILFMLL